MGRKFVPTLIHTTTWTPYHWETVGLDLSDKIHNLVHERDVDGIYELIKNDLKDYDEDLVKARIRDFIDDVTGASGVVAISDKVYQEVILAILDQE